MTAVGGRRPSPMRDQHRRAGGRQAATAWPARWTRPAAAVSKVAPARIATRPRTPARPAATKALDGPPASTATPARAAPAAEPIEDAVATQANASVALPAGEA